MQLIQGDFLVLPQFAVVLQVYVFLCFGWFFFLGGGWGLESELRAFAPPVHFGDGDLVNYLPGLASNLNPPNLSLQSSWITCVSHQCPAQSMPF
jgi:hypothetical protein